MMVCLDSNIAIYYVEGNPLWKPKVVARLQSLVAVGDTLAVSDATRLECLVGPLQRGDNALLADYQRFFASPDVRMLPVTVAIWEQAARIRATYKIQALDSIHLASAIEYGCGLFLTSDGQLAKCTAITVETLT